MCATSVLTVPRSTAFVLCQVGLWGSAFFVFPQAGEEGHLRLGDVFPDVPQLFFMGAELFRAVFAVQVFVRRLGEALGSAVERDLPAEQQKHGHSQKRPGIETFDEEKRCEHHRVIPVIDAAGAAAFVLQEPGLERAEKQDADHIADREQA